jgi:hypothetical protein
MSRLDDALRELLKREDPGPEFTERVLARAAAEPRTERSWWRRLAAGFRPPKLRWAMAGALACVLVVASGVRYEREQRLKAEGEAAKQQLLLALRIAGSKLQVAQAKVIERSY